MDCQSARELLATYALSESGDAARIGAARSHVTGCAACQGYLTRFSRSILSFDPDEVTCAEVRSRLDAFEVCGGVGEGMDRVRNHLGRCAACTAEAAAWQSIAALAARGELAEPARYPVFDLSFLPQPQDIWTQVGEGLRRLAYEIPAALALTGRALVPPPAGLAVSFATVQSARRGPHPHVQGEENLVSLSVNDRQEDVHITLDVSEAEKALWLAVSMSMLSSGQVLTGVRVALCNEQGQAQEIKTVRPGQSEARFPNIAPGRYVIRVERAGKLWELPVNL